MRAYCGPDPDPFDQDMKPADADMAISNCVATNAPDRFVTNAQAYRNCANGGEPVNTINNEGPAGVGFLYSRPGSGRRPVYQCIKGAATAMPERLLQLIKPLAHQGIIWMAIYFRHIAL